VLEGVTHEAAAKRPIPGAHSIWEIVLHVTTWAQIARERLKGASIADPTPERDWPPVPQRLSGSDPQFGSDSVSAPDLDDWRVAIEQLAFAHRMLAAEVRELEDEALDAEVPGLEYSVWILLHGIVEHGTYHAGQIALLKRALVS
jgi:uncharacterized damage-inducible protein DinB